ncbi:hypothetical protein [Rhizobium laguerreae]|uniref:hypothetical protein n=1 Tax=Rhizobium laguerreae TaxID=1076926 RepID=UPI001C906ED5|nr:hypothetical protein [Rhizobium laguerreae]MBY3565691.1 hypothetical protein [Rhizobium laguerreae]
MLDHARIKAQIAACNDPEKLRRWIINARNKNETDISEAAFRRLIAIMPQEQPGTVEDDFWQTIHAFEHILTEERGKTTRLARTRQKVARVGVIETLKDWALRDHHTDGFEMLLERSMPELTGEAIILRHRESFEQIVVEAAGTRLKSAGIDVSTLPDKP